MFERSRTLPEVIAEAVIESAVVVVPVKVWLKTPVPDAIERFLPAATVVSPFKETAPVPVEWVVAPVWEKLPSAVIAPIPVMSPVVDISQSEELTATVSPLSPRVTTPLAVRVPFAVRPEVAVISPEMVGVAVQAVPVTVRFPPSEVKLLPETVKVLSKVVAP